MQTSLNGLSRVIQDDDQCGVVNGYCVRCHRPVTQFWEPGLTTHCWVGALEVEGELRFACELQVISNIENPSFEEEAVLARADEDIWI